MNKLKLTKNAIGLGASLFSFVISLVYFIKSYSFYQDEYGTDISFNENYVIALICSLIVLCFFGYAVYQTIKNKEVKYSKIVALTCTSLVGFYNFGGFFKTLFKAINKANSKGKPLSDYFVYDEHKAKLYIGILLILVTAYLIIAVIDELKKTKID